MHCRLHSLPFKHGLHLPHSFCAFALSAAVAFGASARSSSLCSSGVSTVAEIVVATAMTRITLVSLRMIVLLSKMVMLTAKTFHADSIRTHEARRMRPQYFRRPPCGCLRSRRSGGCIRQWRDAAQCRSPGGQV